MPIDVRGVAPLLQVFDMPKSIQFYCGVLGFEVAGQSESGPIFDWALLRLNGVEVMLNTAYERDQRPPTPDPRRIAAHKDTALYFGCPDVDAAYRELQGKGLTLKPPVVQRYGMKQLHITDPDGYVLCFQWPVEGDHATRI
jgi:glyoxylase I family protein